MKSIKTFESFLAEKEPTIKPFTVDEPIDTDIDSAIEIDHDDHHESENYMFFGNLETIKRCIDELLLMDPRKVDELLKNGHNWAVDHVVSSKDDIEEVYNFFKNEMTEEPSEISENEKSYICEDCGTVYEAEAVDESGTCSCGGIIKENTI